MIKLNILLIYTHKPINTDWWETIRNHIYQQVHTGITNINTQINISFTTIQKKIAIFYNWSWAMRKDVLLNVDERNLSSDQ